MTTTVLTDEEIDKALSSVDPTFWDVSTGATEAFARAIEQAVLQSPEVKALRKDADRYGKLVSAWFDDDHSGDFILMNNMPPDAYQSKADIDEDIDAMERLP